MFRSIVMRLLVAEDEDAIRRGLVKYIGNNSNCFERIYDADNGISALDSVLKHKPDVILLDISMPGKTGLEVMEDLEKVDYKPVIIIMSCHDEFKYVKAALQFGASDYLLKPISAQEILKCIKKNANITDDEVVAVPNNVTGGVATIVNEAKEYISEHYHEDISLDVVADKIGITGGYLSSILSNSLDCGFVEYVNGIRVDRACGYLKQGYLKVYEIADRVGFNDEKYFAKVFKKMKGVSPREYRRQEM